MKILLGDSITDAGRNHEAQGHLYGDGYAFVRLIADELLGKTPWGSVDLYARIKKDVWNLQPDIISILVGANDVWHEIHSNNGVGLDRYENVYRMMLRVPYGIR